MKSYWEGRRAERGEAPVSEHVTHCILNSTHSRALLHVLNAVWTWSTLAGHGHRTLLQHRIKGFLHCGIIFSWPPFWVFTFYCDFFIIVIIIISFLSFRLFKDESKCLFTYRKKTISNKIYKCIFTKCFKPSKCLSFENVLVCVYRLKGSVYTGVGRSNWYRVSTADCNGNLF